MFHFISHKESLLKYKIMLSAPGTFLTAQFWSHFHKKCGNETNVKVECDPGNPKRFKLSWKNNKHYNILPLTLWRCHTVPKAWKKNLKNISVWAHSCTCPHSRWKHQRKPHTSQENSQATSINGFRLLKHLMLWKEAGT